MSFQGYLIKSASGSAVFPHKYIKLETYKGTPNQREEVDAYRDDYTRDLYREVADGMKSTIEFSTVDGLTLAEKEEIQSFFNSCMTDAIERKVYLNYWDDETNQYDTGYFYLPNMTYTIRQIDSTNIIYNSLAYKLIEY